MSRGVNKNDVVKMYLDGMSIPEVSGAVGFSRSTIRYHLLKAGVLRSRADGVRNAAKRGRIGSGFRGKTRVFTEEHKRAISESRKRWAEDNAKGSSVKPSGYVEYTRGKNKGRSQHRVIMEEILGRKLSSDEHVHHIDGDRSNNDPSNLMVMTASEHAAHHAMKNLKNRRRRSDGTWS